MAKKSSSGIIPPFMVGSDQKYNPWGGLNTIVKDNRFLYRGDSYDQLNWITGRDKDHIELRRGSLTLGKTKRNVPGAKVNGLGVGIKNTGEQVPLYSFNRKVFYYDNTLNDTVEIGTDMLPAGASADHKNFMPYQNLAGSYAYLTSKNSGIYKISIANLGSFIDLGITDYHFNFAKINRGYMYGMVRKGASQNSNDSTGAYQSVPDSIQNNSTTIPFAVGTGDGVTQTFAGTIVLTPPNTAYFVAITDTVETFTDDKDGHLVGSLGGTGTINYITGAYSVTFNTAPANLQAITGSYYAEDSTTGGVADFIGTGSDTFRQDDGGGVAQAIWSYQGVEYCLHQLRSWLLTADLTQTPITFSNQPYYEQIGIPGPDAAFPTGDGILFLNNAIPTNPKISILQIPPGSTNLTVVPVSISDVLDLSGYGIDECAIFRWNDWDFVSVKGIVNGQVNQFNSVTFIRNIVSGLWNQLGNFFIQNGADFRGQLIAGSSIGPNVMELFTGFADNGTFIPNYHAQAFTDLNLQGLKTVGYLNFSGLIAKGQMLDVFISLDNGAYVKVYTIMGNGPYVSSQVIAVGTQGIGIGVVGGGYDQSQVFASRYEFDIPIHTSKFEYISWKIQATGKGYVSVEQQQWKDIRWKRRRLLSYEDQEIDN